ncbi:RING-H2 finger protein ATL33-like [Chenopodium quinoa]|nr:RING-H2 finger protein ATL33-like [Chenopodium quinoa]
MMSSISFIVMLLIMIIIPTILYTFFFLISCPPNPLDLLRRLRRRTGVETIDPSRRSSKVAEEEDGENTSNKDKNNVELVIASSSTPGKDDVDCPICLADFIEGEELRQLKICKHLFHRICIDKWLSSHCICPICRTIVSQKQAKIMKEREINRVLAARRDFDRHDHWQGLPDSAGLV